MLAKWVCEALCGAYFAKSQFSFVNRREQKLVLSDHFQKGIRE
jgi:heme/copper-type cytochrome/quinol oxidase subunit 2